MVDQLHAYVRAERKRAFEAYASSCLIDAGTLLRLLICRELRRNSLEQGGTVEIPPGPPAGGKNRPKITAHFRLSNEHRKAAEAFERLAERVGHDRTNLARVLLERELTEKWLARCLAS